MDLPEYLRGPDLSLGQKQRLLTWCLPLLLDRIHELGYECTLGDAFRDGRAHGKVGEQGPYGNAFSLHKSRLALDINLFVDGEWITSSDHPAWDQLGSYWESLHPACLNARHIKDANHFAISHGGRI